MTRQESHKKIPKKTCQNCKDQTCLKTGKPCEEIETLLRSEGVKSRDWIRPKISNKLDSERGGYGRYREIPFSSFKQRDFTLLGVDKEDYGEQE